MAIEIEHKYLVDMNLWKLVKPEKSVDIKQAYLLTDPDKTIRVRTKGAQGYITIKGRAVASSRPEFEYEIPLEDAHELIRYFCTNLVEKTRHLVTFEGKTWEVDEFHGANNGLMVAEIELNAEDEVYAKPAWVGNNVTADSRYANSQLAVKPFMSW
ncbi:MAG: CYTH domain-containing protein [Bacteroidetes bacterium]|nr:CYTH domain-containing protein [Bacteroidota bacterium]